MNNTAKPVSFALGLLCLGLTFPAGAVDTIYDNSASDLGVRLDSGTAVVGDEINLAGTSRWLTQFDFEYWGTNTANPSAFAGSVTADVKIYLNDGTPFHGYATPGTVLFDSGWFGGFGPTARSTIVFTAGAGSDFGPSGLFLPSSDITWSVQFQGMGTTDSLGVDIYNPPAVGSSAPDYWQNSGSGWVLLTNTVPMNFASRMFASANPVPEPSPVPLTMLGGFAAWAAARWTRKK